jgi:hypothetical protein
MGDTPDLHSVRDYKNPASRPTLEKDQTCHALSEYQEQIFCGLPNCRSNHASRNCTLGDSAGRGRCNIHPKVEPVSLPPTWRELTLQQNPRRTLLQSGLCKRRKRPDRKHAVVRRHCCAICRPRWRWQPWSIPVTLCVCHVQPGPTR